MPTTSDSSSSRRRRAGAVERLYVYWIVSTALLVLAFVFLSMYLSGALSEQIRRIDQLAMRIRELEARLQAAERSEPSAGVRVTPAPRPADRGMPVGRPSDSAAPNEQASAAGREQADVPGNDLPAGMRKQAPGEAWVRAELDAVLEQRADSGWRIRAPERADKLVVQVLPFAGQAGWSGPTWTRLAMAARLLSRHAAADAFARQAYQAGEKLVDYAAVSARRLLAEARPREALPHAKYYAGHAAHPDEARLLLAQVWLRLGEVSAADESLAGIADPTRLPPRERVTLARTALELQRWDQLVEAMSALEALPDGVPAREYNYLHAVALIQQHDRLPEALAVLDELAAASAAVGAQPGPSGEEVATWRGVALCRGGRNDAAREAFRLAVELRPGAPEPYYWWAQLERRAGAGEEATRLLEKAVTADPDFAPAWEALGALALESGQPELAAERAQHALAANPRRASAHFLAALAYAHSGDREAVATALRAAFRLEPAYFEEARLAEVITDLMSPDELAALLPEGGAPAP